MATGSSEKTSGRRLVGKMTCPNCWHTFHPEDVLFAAKHPDLLGDPVLGENEYRRFLPERFNANGEALDAKGFATSEMACPHCHLRISDALLEVPPLFISMTGAPACGKSYFLATMSWELRRLLPQAYLSFSDADPTASGPIHEYEHILFMNPDPDRPTEIPKTQAHDPKFYRTTLIDGAEISFPSPLQYLLWPTPEHPAFAKRRRIGRVVVLYDNAGEDFLPGAEDVSSAAVQHLAKSQILFFFFDPTQDPRFRAQCKSQDPQLVHGIRPGAGTRAVNLRQETLLTQAAVRIRRYLGLSQEDPIRKLLIVLVAKFDILQDMTDVSVQDEPYANIAGDRPSTLDVAKVEQAGDRIRKLFLEVCPEFVATAESMFAAVHFIPVSSLGGSPEYVSGDDRSFYGIRPKNVKPRWVTVPLLFSLCKYASGLIARTP